MFDIESVYAGGHFPANPKWLVQNAIRLGQAGLVYGLNDQSMAIMGLAMIVASRPRRSAPTKAYSLPVAAHGSAVVLRGVGGKDDVCRQLAVLDPTGERREACADRLVMRLGRRRLFALSAGGEHAPTKAAADLTQELLSIKDLKLVAFDPLTAFLPAEWAADPSYIYSTSMWFGRLAIATRATVLGAMSEAEHQLLQEVARKCH